MGSKMRRLVWDGLRAGGKIIQVDRRAVKGVK